MVNRLKAVLLTSVVLTGCSSQQVIFSESTEWFNGVEAVVQINQQIEEFNDTRSLFSKGISPIRQRTVRVSYDKQKDQITCFDQGGKSFLVLERETSGRFKGILEVPYHEAAFSRLDGSHSWGHILAEFYLEI